MEYKNNAIKFLAGITSGITSTFIFNPYDKALYSSVTNNRPFICFPLITNKKPYVSWPNWPISKLNWQNPYSGVNQAILHRTISYGLYFPLFDMFKGLHLNLNENINAVSSGVLTGITSALILNPINVIKFNNWNHGVSNGISSQAKLLYRQHGLMCFSRGLKYTLIRDVQFGALYSYLTLKYNPDHKVFPDVLFAIMATTCAAPINYCRAMVFATSHSQNPPSFTQICAGLKEYSIKKICLNKFCLGYGTMRVGLGMALSRQIYEGIISLNKTL